VSQINSLGGGKVVQVVETSSGALFTTTNLIPFDDTVPLITEGGEVLTLNVTPKSTLNSFRVKAGLQLAFTAANINKVLTVRRADGMNDSIIAVKCVSNANVNFIDAIEITHEYPITQPAQHTFSIRVGAELAGTTTVNGSAGLRKYGGAMNTYLCVMEIEP